MAIDLAFDEGGCGNTLLVSMQLTEVERAKRLKRDWNSKLARKGVEFFHSQEFDNSSAGVFKELSGSERTELLCELGVLIRNHISTGATVKINVDLYNTVTTDLFRSRWGTAYSFAIRMLILEAHEYCEYNQLGHDLNILIESGHRHSKQAIQLLEETKNDLNGFFMNILTVGLGNKKAHPILQSADMLVFSEWQQMQNGNLDIYDTLHVDDSPYEPLVVEATEETIRAMTGTIDGLIDRMKEFGRRRHEEKQRIRKLQSHNGSDSKS